MLTLTPPPIAMSAAELDARITYLARAVDRATERGRWQESEDYQDALDACLIERAERGAREPEAVARCLDAYAVTIDDVFERR